VTLNLVHMNSERNTELLLREAQGHFPEPELECILCLGQYELYGQLHVAAFA